MSDAETERFKFTQSQLFTACYIVLEVPLKHKFETSSQKGARSCSWSNGNAVSRLRSPELTPEPGSF